MAKKLIFISVVAVWTISLGLSVSLSAEKLKFGTATQFDPMFYLPAVVAEEKGFWKEQALEVDYTAFRGGPPLYKAVVAGEIKMGTASGPSVLQTASAGVPLLIVAQVKSDTDFYLWTRPGSPIRETKDIKGAKIGVTSLGSLTHIYAQAVVKGLGLEKDVKFVGSGGIAESMAALKAGVIDLMPNGIFSFLELELKGELRRRWPVADHLPKEWAEAVVFSERDFAKNNPETVRRGVRAIVKAVNFMGNNPGWTMEKVKSLYGYSEEAARKAYEFMNFPPGGKIDAKALENMTNFLLHYGLIREGKALPLKEVYTIRFIE